MIPALRLAGFCLIGFAACRVPGPLPPTRTVAPAVVAPAEAGTGWQGSARPGAESETVASERERQNHTSALGMGPGPIGPDRPRVVFADRFRHAAGWRGLRLNGRPHPEPVAVDEEGWVERLEDGQIAAISIPVVPGETLVLSWTGDGRLELEGAGVVRSVGANQSAFRAKTSPLVLRLERTSPSAPIRNIRILPSALADVSSSSRFDPAFLEQMARFSVLRFADWARVGKGGSGAWADRVRPEELQGGPGGVAYEHMIALANEVGADLWLSLPFIADVEHVRELMRLVKDRSRPESLVYVEFGDEPWRTVGASPGRTAFFEEAQRTFPREDSGVARLYLQARRSRELFEIAREVLGEPRVQRVLAVPVGAPATARLLLELEGLGTQTDALAVGPEVGAALVDDWAAGRPKRLTAKAILDRMERTELPASLSRLREVSRVAHELGLRMVAYRGGLGLAPPPLMKPARAAPLEQAARSPRAGTLLSALLDRWKDEQGQTFVLGPLDGVGDEGLASDSQIEAAERFVDAHPRWWQRPEPPPPVMAEVEPDPAPSALMAATAPEPEVRYYTAPWAKWLTFGAAAVVGGFTAERFISAHGAAADRDDALAGLEGVSDPTRYDGLQDTVRDADGERDLAQTMGFIGAGVTTALVTWAIFQWLDEPPEPELPDWAEAAE